MDSTDEVLHDVMQVCRNGHVITDLLRAYPERGLSHCDRCGAETLDRCPTCGRELPGAVAVPGPVPVGHSRPPQYCAACGAAFPWTEQPAEPVSGPEVVLETFLRRLPRTIRALRSRHDNRPPFRVADEHDLEDLLRALLPLYFDQVLPESRTPSYAPGTRTDFLIVAENPAGLTAVLVKHIAPALGERQLAQHWEEDVTYYARQPRCRLVVGFVYDPEGRLHDPRQLEATWSKQPGPVGLRCVIAS
ncbi:MAG TPA: DUF2321 domain-containing protein [Gemmataceae bacterium]|jgi:hypothetical protein|nr:DUF2321 domain-containing protein [Gemmataceae bacterium]